MMAKLPKKIEPCPIVEAVVEIRFSSILPSEAVFGVIYSQISDDFSKTVNKLPILQIPEAVRSKDPNFTYSPHYSLIKSDVPLKLNIGPRAITFANVTEYIGWEKFFRFVKEILGKIEGTGVIHVPERIGVRYINYFDTQILDKLNLKINLDSDMIVSESTTFRTEITRKERVIALQVSNNVPVTINRKSQQGSLIDIDCVYDFTSSKTGAFTQFYSIIDESHTTEKEIFFGLLNKGFLEELNPQY